ncbi:MAG TPA: 6-carboxytetrahydropterin synthase [Thermoanaerobaculia bacterium]|nr:6-carboxytetrahydropterin synthase [Thermoanaerobaculia bacterium]
MYRVTVEARFEAAHFLIHYRGQPEPLHGHSYRVEVALEAETLDPDDLAIDFVAAKDLVRRIAAELDYRNVNDHPAFAGRNTSAENIARHFAERIAASGRLAPARVAEVTVWEGPENRATYTP